MERFYISREGPSLNEVLAQLGLRTEPADGNYRKRVIDSDGEVLVTGDAADVWRWLRETGRWA